jgi:calcium channel MID1
VCSVAIPRCEDFSATDSFLQMRNINAPFANGSKVAQDIIDTYSEMKAFSSSRVPTIDTQVQPGPYKEVLPCDDLCYNLVQSCPASMDFACPTFGNPGFNTSYGRRQTAGDANVTCNYPGSAHVISASSLNSVPWAAMAGLVGTIMLLLL